MKARVFWLFGAVFMASCGYTAPYQVSAPAPSKDGVQVHLLGQRCFVNRSAEQYPTTVDDDRLNVEVDLQLANASARPARVSLGSLQLSGGAGAGAAVVLPVLPEQATVVTLSPGERRTVGLDFETRTTLDCRRSFALEMKDAVAIEGQPTR